MTLSDRAVPETGLVEELRDSASHFLLEADDRYSISIRDANSLVGACLLAATTIKAHSDALEAMGREVAEARAEIERLNSVLSFEKRASRLNAKNAESATLQRDEAMAALRPFAAVAAVFDHAVKPAPRADEHEVHSWDTAATGPVAITVGDFRRARSVLAPREEEA